MPSSNVAQSVRLLVAWLVDQKSSQGRDGKPEVVSRLVVACRSSGLLPKLGRPWEDCSCSFVLSHALSDCWYVVICANFARIICALAFPGSPMHRSWHSFGYCRSQAQILPHPTHALFWGAQRHAPINRNGGAKSRVLIFRKRPIMPTSCLGASLMLPRGGNR